MGEIEGKVAENMSLTAEVDQLWSELERTKKEKAAKNKQHLGLS